MKKPKKPPAKAKTGGQGGQGGGQGPGQGHSTGHAGRITRPLPKRGLGGRHGRGLKGGHPKSGHPKHSTGHAGHLTRHLPAKKPKVPKKRQWSPGYDLACCSAQAVGTLLGLTDDEVLALYWQTASDPDSGASIERTLSVAGVPMIDMLDEHHPFSARGFEFRSPERIWNDGDLDLAPVGHGLILELPAPEVISPPRTYNGSWILGLDLPEGPHAVLATADGWWSWGELYDPSGFGGAVIEEAWAVLL